MSSSHLQHPDRMALEGIMPEGLSLKETADWLSARPELMASFNRHMLLPSCSDRDAALDCYTCSNSKKLAPPNSCAVPGARSNPTATESVKYIIGNVADINKNACP